MTFQATDLPDRIARLPRDRNGYPVPWFVAWIDGVPDFRIMDPHRLVEAIRDGRCWTCGGTLGSNRSYVIGPMCAVNRTSAEPPSHHDCAVFSATHCPFLVNPKKRRREGHKPEGTTVAGTMIARNPGVALVWNTRGTKPYRVHNGVLFDIGEPKSVEWYAEGRQATRAEVMASIDSGLPTLRTIAVEEGHGAVEALDKQVERAMVLVPVR